MEKMFWIWIFFVGLFLLSRFSDVSAASSSLKITHPLSGEKIEGYIVEVKFEVKNFVLKDYRTNTQPAAGRGHLNFWLDQERTDEDTARKWFREAPYTFADVTPGDHTLVVELTGNDGQPLEPRVRESISFRTEAPKVSEETGGRSTAAPASISPTPGVDGVGRLRESNSSTSGVTGVRFPILAGLVSLFLGILGTLILKR